TGKHLAPSVYLLPPAGEELSSNRLHVTLTCHVTGFYPSSISVEWQKNQETLDAGSYDTIQPIKEKTG
ncbi:IGG2C protein, partial [Scopus umbretta]|nr:IGG2C protein [Scopus umbretta]